jgi:hypothetical protein
MPVENTVKFRWGAHITKEVMLVPVNTLILIRSEWESTYYKSWQDKLEAMQWSQPDDLVLFSWQGKYSTDIFQLLPEDIERILSE